MSDQLPSLFIGSSTEGLDIAREVELQLHRDSVTTIWKDGVFGLGGGTLESLMNALDQFDFAVMVLSPNDLIESRGQSYASPRDNVLFELGLFMGRLGRSRLFTKKDKKKTLNYRLILLVSRYHRIANVTITISRLLFHQHAHRLLRQSEPLNSWKSALSNRFADLRTSKKVCLKFNP
jgi:Predicted nucleotide-binding protein containing TIR-like domain